MPADANSTYLANSPTPAGQLAVGRAGATSATPPMATPGSTSSARVVLVTISAPVQQLQVDRSGQTSFFATGATVPRPRGTVGLLYPLQG